VLQTLKFTQPSAKPGAASEAQYVRWQDPREGAFSVEVPQGWRVDGGMFRFSTADVRGALEMESPDGQVKVVAGDPAVPTHTLPSQMLNMTGFPEGSGYSPGYNVRMLVRRYMTGLQFATEYVQSKLSAGCTGLRLTESRDLPEASQQLSRLYASSPGVVSMQVTAGEVVFAASRNGRPVQGYLFSGTLLVSGQGSGLWQVPFLHGFIASPEQTGAAQSALERLIRSIQVSPAWAQRQQGAVAETSRIVSETNAYVTKVIEDGYWAREQSRSELSRKWSNVTLGQTDVADPETGERWKVASGHNYYWRQNYTDNVAGTNVYDAPDINFSPLVEY